MSYLAFGFSNLGAEPNNVMGSLTEGDCHTRIDGNLPHIEGALQGFVAALRMNGQNDFCVAESRIVKFKVATYITVLGVDFFTKKCTDWTVKVFFFHIKATRKNIFPILDGALAAFTLRKNAGRGGFCIN